MTERLDPWIEGYLSYLLDVRRLTRESVRDIRCALKKVATFMAQHAPDKALWQLELRDYLAWINHERDLKRSALTTAKEITHVRGLLNYSWRSGRCTRNVLDGFCLKDVSKLNRQLPHALSLKEAGALVAACPTRSFIERRSRIIILILYGCGLRNSELCQLDMQDIDIETQELLIRKAKNDRQRRVPVPDAVWTELLAYLAERGGKRGALFKTDHKKKRMRTTDMSRVVKSAARRAGLQGHITPKTLRHTFGTHLAYQGVDIGVIATLMGHRSPKETSVYLHVLEGKKQAAVDQLVSEGGRS